MDWAYSEVVKEHFMNPRNLMDPKEKFDFNGKGTVGNIKCGDEMTFYVKVDKESDTITDCRWRTYGCASAIASTSALSEKIKGMKTGNAYKLKPQDILAMLEGLPENKVHCSVLGDKALRYALNDYYNKNAMEERVVSEEVKVVCQCMNVTDKEIEEAVLEGTRTYLDLQEKTKIGTVCGQCKEEASKLIEVYKEKYFD